MTDRIMRFERTAVNPEGREGGAYYFCFLNDDILVNKNSEDGFFPLLTEETAKELGFECACLIGLLNDKLCYVAGMAQQNVSDEYQWVDLRDIFLNDGKEKFDIAGYAKQIFNWNMNFRFCGRCGRETAALPNEHARVCETCQLINYPRISPAIITAVIKDDQILLARGRNYRYKKMFSVLAGFLEPGESLEGCVKREIFEEVGIKVKNIRYFKSQPWPFPDSLMIGFTAEYESGEIEIDETEIAEAAWFKADALPEVPNKRSISSELIQWFVKSGF